MGRDLEKDSRATDIVAAYAKRYAVSIRNFRRLITGLEREAKSYYRIAYRIESRNIVQRSQLALSTNLRNVRDSVDPNGRDPWGVDIERLAELTCRLSTCSKCNGRKKTFCQECSGTAKVDCSQCRGRGQVAGERKMIRCPKCRGNQRVRCKDCKSGKIQCSNCQGIGRNYTWLEVCRSFRVAVIVVPEDPDLGLSEIHADRYEQGNIDLPSQHFPVPLVNDTDWIDEEQPEIDAQIRRAIYPKTERIIGRRIQEFSTYVRRLTYRTRFGEGRAYVAEQPGAVLSSSIWKPLRDRLSSAVVVFLMTLLLGLLVHYLHTSRSGWFEENGMSAVILVASCIAASFGAWFALEIGLPKHLVRKDNLGFSLMGVSCSWFAIAVCWFATGPSLANASKLIQENDFRRANVEIQAYQRIHGREKASVGLKSELAEILAKNKQAEHERMDRQHLEEVESTLDVFDAVDKLGAFWHDRTLHRRARNHVKILADEYLRDAASSSDVGSLNKMQNHLRYVDSNLVERVRFYVKIIEVTVCIESQDYECAYRKLKGTKDPPNDEMALERWNSQRKQLIHNLNKELQHTAFEPKDLDARKIQIERALRYAEMYQSLIGENAHRKISSLWAKHKQVISSIANKEKRKEAALIRKARSESRRGRARSHRKKTTKPKRSRSGNRVQCCDGSYSPSCTYSQGSLRGCCSHHKGVCWAGSTYSIKNI